jgi:hypothetical protein
MTTIREVAEALVAAGYLSPTDVELAMASMTESLHRAGLAGEVADRALEDEARQEEAIAGATEAIVEFDEMMEFEYESIERDIIAEAAAREQEDEEIVEEEEEEMVHAYAEAAGSLVAAGLIDSAKASDAAAVIAETWERGR